MKRKYSFFILVSGILVLLYAWLIEPQWIEVNQYPIQAPVDSPLKIMQISDLHTKGNGFVEKKVFQIIEEQRPDIILLTGDISSPGSTIQDYKQVLSKIKAPKGVYFVTGNWEYWVPVNGLQSLLSDSGITNLDNSNIKLSGNTWLVGFDDVLEGNPNETLALKDVPTDAFKIGMFHTPIYFNQIYKKINLSLSGHSHGGQMRIPFIKPFWLPAGTGEFIDGWFSRENSKMYVSRGIGNSILPFRFFCRPEIAIFSLSSP